MAAECIEAEGVLYIPVLVVGLADIFRSDGRVEPVLCVALTIKNHRERSKVSTCMVQFAIGRDPPCTLCAELYAVRNCSDHRQVALGQGDFGFALLRE